MCVLDVCVAENGCLNLHLGGSDGVGKASALEFAKLGATVIIASRNLAKLDHAREHIARESGNKNVMTI